MKKLLLAALVIVLCPAMTLAATMVGNTGETIDYEFTGHVLTATPGTDADYILYMPTEADDAAFRSSVAALTGATVDYFDPRAVVPDVATLEMYDAVMTWVNYAYLDNVATGDNLAAYVDGGGKVILGQWTQPTAGNYLSGMIMTSAYNPVSASFYLAGTYNGDGEDCVWDGVTTIDSSYYDVCTLVAGTADGTVSHGGVAAAWRDDRMVYSAPGNTGSLYTIGETDVQLANMVDCSAGPLMPKLTLKVNGSTGPVTVVDGAGELVIEFEFLARAGMGFNAEIYLVLQRMAGGWWSYDGAWGNGRNNEYFVGPLMDLGETLADILGPVPPGDYAAHLVLDTSPDGVLNRPYDVKTVEIGVLPAGTEIVLVCDFSGASGAAQVTALNDLGFATELHTTLPADLGLYAAAFVDLGIFGFNNHVLTAGEGDQLVAFMDAGKGVYMEGGDTWYYDLATAAHAYFGITGLSDGSSDTFGVTGVAGTFTDGMDFVYAGNNSWMDQLAAVDPAYAIFTEATAGYVDGVANGTYKTVGCSFDFGGLVDGASPSTQMELMTFYAGFLGL